MTDVLTLDLGNSRIKLRRWAVRDGARPALAAASARVADLELPLALSTELDALGPVDRVALCSVADPALEARVVDLLRDRFGGRLEVELDPGLVVEVRAPERVGRDRLFAARGAWSLRDASALVVDAGTCVTVDALAVDRAPGTRSARPRFLGGAIAPGPDLLADALARGGARLLRVAPRPGVAALGRDTEEALLAGIVVGLRGAVRELVLGIGAEAGLGSAPLVWTGGARALLCEPPLFPTRENLEEPELVHLGLLSALGHTWPEVG